MKLLKHYVSKTQLKVLDEINIFKIFFKCCILSQAPVDVFRLYPEQQMFFPFLSEIQIKMNTLKIRTNKKISLNITQKSVLNSFMEIQY